MRASFGNATAEAPKAPAPAPPAKSPKSAKPAGTPSAVGTLFYPLQLTPPDVGRLFALESEEAFRERLRHEARIRGVRHPVEFPGGTSQPQSRETLRSWPETTKVVEPSYVISGVLFWEQPGLERYGQDLGILQPGVATSLFFFDTLGGCVYRMTHPRRWNQINMDSYSPYFYRLGQPEYGSAP